MMEIRKITLPNKDLLEEVGELIANGNTVKLRVKGNSMNPFFVNNRDEVILSPFTKKDLRPGAIVLAKDQYERFVLHRIIRIQGEQIILKGDGNIKGIEHTTPNNTLGVVTAAIRNGKKIECAGICWNSISFLWRILYPFRYWLLAIWRKAQ